MSRPAETAAEAPTRLPVLPLKETVVFPESMTPLAVGQERSIKLIDDVVAGERMLALLTVKDGEDEQPDEQRGDEQARGPQARGPGKTGPVPALGRRGVAGVQRSLDHRREQRHRGVRSTRRRRDLRTHRAPRCAIRRRSCTAYRIPATQ